MADTVSLSLYIYLFAIAISTVVALMIKAITFVFDVRGAPEPSTSQSAKPQDKTADRQTEEIPVAAISAAVYAVAGPHRIVHIEHGVRSPAWVTAGRARHHAAHNIPRRRH